MEKNNELYKCTCCGKEYDGKYMSVIVDETKPINERITYLCEKCFNSEFYNYESTEYTLLEETAIVGTSYLELSDDYEDEEDEWLL